MVHITTRIDGVKRDLKTLNKLAPDLRRQITKDAKTIVKPVVQTASSKYPDRYLSGFARNWQQRGKAKFPYNRTKAIRGVSVKVDTRKKALSVITIIQKDPAATIIDMAGKKGGNNQAGRNMIAGLSMYFGGPSRVMWPSYNANSVQVNANMVELVDEISRQINIAIQRSIP
jgi:hypothetical protein